ncbi:cg1 protein, putative [Plasmodium gallinaceum]|uniref:Cg1 protein, putative n=1 Tax=Plasmodium gallinaceum TaxID=5849 RepID=A0A1J1H3Y0_PLAGA|nr:cg1 protein, putative [Plasmodium gallinaceum]CRG98058.1 cg1 protein, putative [Plasmodium gallinaceum]
MLRFLILIANILICICFLNTKYQIQLDYSIPSALINYDKSLKYTNVTIGKDSFLCILNKKDDNYVDYCEKYDLFKNIDNNDINNYVEEKLNKNYLLNYVDKINYKLSLSDENSKNNEIKRNYYKKDEKNIIHKKKRNVNRKIKKIAKNENKESDLYENGRSNENEELNNIFNCNFKKIYDYIFYKRKFNAYHKNRIYDKINDQVTLKNHIIKGKMLTLSDMCIDVFSNGDILKICLNKSITFITNRYSNYHKKHVSISNYLNGKDLLFTNNTVVQYYSDGKYFFEVLFLCGNNNLRINSFERLYNIYYPLIFEIYERLNMNLTRFHNIIIKKLKYNNIHFFKTFSLYTYSDSYYNSLKDKLNEILNSYYTNVNYLYRITLSAYMFCDYTDQTNPPNHYLLKNLMNKCYNFSKNDEYIYEICLPYSVIKYKKDSYGKAKYPIVLLGSSYVSVNEGKPFYEKTYDSFPVLKSDYIKKKDTENYFKVKNKFTNPNSLFTSLSSSAVNSVSNSKYTPLSTFGYTSTFTSDYSPSSTSFSSSNPSNFHNSYPPFFYTYLLSYSPLDSNSIPYVSSYIIDKPMEILKYGNENFYKALAIDLKGEKCKDSLDEVYDYITTIYFDCSLHFKNEVQTKIINVFQSTECHYYVHISSPFMCAHPTLHTAVPSKNEVIKCFKNVYAASSQLQNNSQNKYEYENIYKNNIEEIRKYENFIENSNSDNTFTNENVLRDNYISNEDKFHLYEFNALKYKIFKNKDLVYLEALPKEKKIEFGQKHDFGLGNYLRKRVYKSSPLFHIGNVVKHKYWNYHATVVSWDFVCYAPNEWKKNIYSEYPAEFKNTVHYLLLINKKKDKNYEQNYMTHSKKNYFNKNFIKNGINKKTFDFINSNEIYDENFHFAYVPESSLVYSDKMIYSEYLSQFFEKYNDFFHFYIPKKNHILWKLFPYDFFNLVY